MAWHSTLGLAGLLGRYPERRLLMTGEEVQADQLIAMEAKQWQPLSLPDAAIR